LKSKPRKKFEAGGILFRKKSTGSKREGRLRLLEEGKRRVRIHTGFQEKGKLGELIILMPVLEDDGISKESRRVRSQTSSGGYNQKFTPRPRRICVVRKSKGPPDPRESPSRKAPQKI